MKGRVISLDWVYKYFSAVAIISGIGFLIRYLIQKKIDSYFSTKLEKYKQDLNLLTEQTKYDLNKKMFDFEAFASQKHSIYPELYRRLFAIWWDFNEYINCIKSDNPNITLFDEKSMRVNSNQEEAIRYYKEVELYLSKEVASKSWTYLITLQNQILTVEPTSDWGIVRRSHDEILDKLNLLKEQLHKELSYSHFE